MKSSTDTKEKDIKRKWHLIDLKGKTLGRVSTEIAGLLMGKSKSNFVRHLDMGDYVVLINAKEIKVTGKKEDQKKYYRHSGYPGGFKAETLRELRIKKPEEIIRHAVSGMLPQNRLRAKMLKRLKVFSGENHTFQDKFKE
ncbi:MAG: 50S ribosomal protein L13 [Candidatus Levybacteria bacterium RBG_16_35_11]|nr:MAG: 50S ribosomal protein L13 [Candidatus Levybacteria bacterium RBG_16_35_11]